jgi:hypothetical protein
MTADLTQWAIDMAAYQARLDANQAWADEQLDHLTQRLHPLEYRKARRAMTPSERARVDKVCELARGEMASLRGMAAEARPQHYRRMSLPLRRQVALAYASVLEAIDALTGGDVSGAREQLLEASNELVAILRRNPYQARQSRSPSAFPEEMHRIEWLALRIESTLGGLRQLEVAS